MAFLEILFAVLVAYGMASDGQIVHDHRTPEEKGEVYITQVTPNVSP